MPDSTDNATLVYSRIAGSPVHIPRVLEVSKAKLCYVVGTVYMEMPLKPSVMEDIARDVCAPTSASGHLLTVPSNSNVNLRL